MTLQTGRVVSVNISTEKGTAKSPVASIAIGPEGIDGDAHAGPWHRQVSLLARESIDRFGEEAGSAFNNGDFAENITTEGIDLSSVAVLDRFASGEVELEVTQLGKRCHGDGCAIYREVGRCVMPKEGIFCRVIKGGAIKAGDTLSLIHRPLRVLVITLSDRASRGDYEDRSGPKVVEILEGFFQDKRPRLETESLLLEDDPDGLRAAFVEARDAGVDAVFTTGGTGIGPRDITPDVVIELANKRIPGVMEAIRIRYGADKPNALLSRSVAAIMGRTLVYTLPGSVRAVDEYMAEILKTFEHAFLMLHAIDAH